MRTRKEINRISIPFILVNGIFFLLMIIFGKTGEKGLFTLSNLFNTSIILTITIFAAYMLRKSVAMTIDLFRKKVYGFAVGQIELSILILSVAGSVIWVLVSVIVKNIK
jgi:hypothetical protein